MTGNPNAGILWDERHPHTPRELVKKLYEVGFTLAQVASITGEPEGSIRDVLIRQGVQMRPKNYTGPGRKLSHDALTTPAFLYEHMRMSMSEIARVLGLGGESTVRSRLRTHGTQIRPKSEAIRLGIAKTTPEARSARARRAYATRRKNATKEEQRGGTSETESTRHRLPDGGGVGGEK